MKEIEKTRALNLARNILQYNIEAKHYSNVSIFSMNQDKIKSLKMKRDKLDAMIKILYSKSKSEKILFNINDGSGFSDNINTIIKNLIGD